MNKIKYKVGDKIILLKIRKEDSDKSFVELYRRHIGKIVTIVDIEEKEGSIIMYHVNLDKEKIWFDEEFRKATKEEVMLENI